MEQNAARFTKGFNNGYLLAMHEPSLLAQLVKQLTPSGEYLEGLFSGKNEYELEHGRSQLDELAQLREHDKDRSQDLEHT